MVFKNNVKHEETVNGLVYRTMEESEIEKAVDFYFDVFLKGTKRLKNESTSILTFS